MEHKPEQSWLWPVADFVDFLMDSIKEAKKATTFYGTAGLVAGIVYGWGCYNHAYFAWFGVVWIALTYIVGWFVRASDENFSEDEVEMRSLWLAFLACTYLPIIIGIVARLIVRA